MEKYYFKNAKGVTVFVEVTEEQKKALIKMNRRSWRLDAKEAYHTTSLDAIEEAGHVFVSEELNGEEAMIAAEELLQDKLILKKLKTILPLLTPLQRKTLYKVCVRKMNGMEIAEEEGLAKQVVYRRLENISKKIKKLLEKQGD